MEKKVGIKMANGTNGTMSNFRTSNYDILILYYEIRKGSDNPPTILVTRAKPVYYFNQDTTAVGSCFLERLV